MNSAIEEMPVPADVDPDEVPALPVAAKRDGGFSLVELLVVVVIIGVLAGVATVGATGLRTRAQSSSCDQELRNVETAVVLFETDTGNGPSDIGDLVPNYLDELPSWHTIAPVTFAIEATGACA